MVNLSVGEGTVVNGTFSDLDWSQSVFMKEELDTGSGYQDMGAMQLASVPVAEYAKISGLNTISSTISLDDTITSFITTGVVSATGFKGNADEITITDSGTLSKLIDIIKDLRNEISSLKKNDKCLIISPGSISEIKDSFCVGETPPIISETSSPVTDGEK